MSGAGGELTVAAVRDHEARHGTADGWGAYWMRLGEHGPEVWRLTVGESYGRERGAFVMGQLVPRTGMMRPPRDGDWTPLDQRGRPVAGLADRAAGCPGDEPSRTARETGNHPLLGGGYSCLRCGEWSADPGVCEACSAAGTRPGIPTRAEIHRHAEQHPVAVGGAKTGTGRWLLRGPDGACALVHAYVRGGQACGVAERVLVPEDAPPPGEWMAEATWTPVDEQCAPLPLLDRLQRAEVGQANYRDCQRMADVLAEIAEIAGATWDHERPQDVAAAVAKMRSDADASMDEVGDDLLHAYRRGDELAAVVSEAMRALGRPGDYDVLALPGRAREISGRLLAPVEDVERYRVCGAARAAFESEETESLGDGARRAFAAFFELLGDGVPALACAEQLTRDLDLEAQASAAQARRDADSLRGQLRAVNAQAASLERENEGLRTLVVEAAERYSRLVEERGAQEQAGIRALELANDELRARLRADASDPERSAGSEEPDPADRVGAATWRRRAAAFKAELDRVLQAAHALSDLPYYGLIQDDSGARHFGFGIGEVVTPWVDQRTRASYDAVLRFPCVELCRLAYSEETGHVETQGFEVRVAESDLDAVAAMLVEKQKGIEQRDQRIKEYEDLLDRPDTQRGSALRALVRAPGTRLTPELIGTDTTVLYMRLRLILTDGGDMGEAAAVMAALLHRCEQGKEAT